VTYPLKFQEFLATVFMLQLLALLSEPPVSEVLSGWRHGPRSSLQGRASELEDINRGVVTTPGCR
jgi:hypothetical protein